MTFKKISYHQDLHKQLLQGYIAFDVETTGLNPYQDRIIELGAVRFENGQPIAKFNLLVDAKVHIPRNVTKINHITNKMLQGQLTENEAYPKFLDFLAEARQGKTLICAHNARFDMGFLENTLQRLGLEVNIKYLYTLALARKNLLGLPNYKQGTIADYLHITNENAHRAYDDALVCGKILAYLIHQ